MNINKALFKGVGGELTYYLTGVGEGCVVILPPGTGSIEYVKPIIDNLSNEFKVVCIEIPGSNGDIAGTAGFDTISLLICDLLKHLQLKNINLIGVSYGGILALKLTGLITINKLVLITVGDFFNHKLRILLRGIFWLPKHVRIFRKLFGLIIQHGRILDLRLSHNTNFDILMDRFWELLGFNLEEKNMFNQALIFFAIKDRILDNRAKEKMKKIILRPRFFDISSGHLDACEKLGEKEYKIMRQYIG